MTSTALRDPAISVRGLEKSYPKLSVLRGVDFEVPAGSIFALLGSNGAGKTTVVKILATLLAADAGTVHVNGFDAATEAADVRGSISLTGQFAAVDEILTGRENLILVARLRHLTGPGAIADALLERFGLTDAARRPVATYSGGMRRRLDLAMSLIGRPSVIFLDEPTTGLDPAKREEMWDVVRKVVADGATVLLTTQYLEEADALADEITVIDHGRVIAQDTPDGLKRVVGGQTLTVRPLDPTRIDEVRAIVGDIARTAPDSPGRGVVSAPVADDAALGAAVRRLEDAGIAVIELSLRLPSLDEVFFALTHHEDQTAVAA